MWRHTITVIMVGQLKLLHDIVAHTQGRVTSESGILNTCAHATSVSLCKVSDLPIELFRILNKASVSTIQHQQTVGGDTLSHVLHSATCTYVVKQLETEC